MENTSGMGKESVVPPEIRRWNWGAFFLTWIWGIGNKTFIALLALIPGVNIVMHFVLGADGSSWAWRNKRWESVKHFQAVQRKWAKWGFAIVILSIVCLVSTFYILLPTLFQDSELFKIITTRLEANSETNTILGRPISISRGIPVGSFKFSKANGFAKIEVGIEGPNGAGKVYVDATKDLGSWRINKSIFTDGASGRQIELSE